MRDIDLIVSYGQSCYQVVDGQRPEHNWLGDKAVTAFLDIGAGGVIAELTGITTVFNLRQRDIAAGGIGVPTVPYGDWVLFTHPGETPLDPQHWWDRQSNGPARRRLA